MGTIIFSLFQVVIFKSYLRIKRRENKQKFFVEILIYWGTILTPRILSIFPRYRKNSIEISSMHGYNEHEYWNIEIPINFTCCSYWCLNCRLIISILYSFSLLNILINETHEFIFLFWKYRRHRTRLNLRDYRWKESKHSTMINFFDARRLLKRSPLRPWSSLTIFSLFPFFPLLAFPLCPPSLRRELNEGATLERAPWKIVSTTFSSTFPPSRLFIATSRAFSPFFCSLPLLLLLSLLPSVVRGPCEPRFNARAAIYGVLSAHPSGGRRSEGRKKENLEWKEREREKSS